MNVGIIGAGFTGLAAALKLVKQGHSVTVFDKAERAGGLAGGFQQPQWQWPLEMHYHHLFVSDHFIIKLAQTVGQPILFSPAKTSVLVDSSIYNRFAKTPHFQRGDEGEVRLHTSAVNEWRSGYKLRVKKTAVRQLADQSAEVYQFDSPMHLLRFDKLPLVDRIRCGAVLAFLKITPWWQPLEHETAALWLSGKMGDRVYELLWQPLLRGKFGEAYQRVNMAWFWARVKKRSQTLGYPQGGFQMLAAKIQNQVEKSGGVFRFGEAIDKILTGDNQVRVAGGRFDRLIVTLPSRLFAQIASLPTDYRARLDNLTGIGSVNLLLELTRPLLVDGTYWLNICQQGWPFLAVVEHTNLVDRRYYDNHHLVYVANYLSPAHPYFGKTAQELLEIYHPYLKRLNPNYRQSIVNAHLFTAPFTQPIIPVNYSRLLPPFQTPLPNVYLANIDQVYPWDRGTNYAVELGQKVADLVMGE